jgi:molybdate/tungstate transport system substrate-binding protein
MIAILMVIIAFSAIVLYRVYVTPASPPLQAYVADAYEGEATAMLQSFHHQSGIPVAPPDTGGSFALARQIAEGERASVFISVVLNAYTENYLQGAYSGWAIAFASDQMVLAYSNATLQSKDGAALIELFKRAYSLNSSALYFNAFSNLTSGSFRIGISDPNSDPAGFRAFLVLEMAGYLYAGSSQYFVHRVIINHSNVTASNAAELVTPLTTGNIQFLFIYKSSALSKGLGMIQLPPDVNLGSPSYSRFYSRFSYNLTTGQVSGSPIYLYISVPATSPDKQEAFQFVSFVVKNSFVLSGFGLVPLSPAFLYNSTVPPMQITNLVLQGYLQYEGAL